MASLQETRDELRTKTLEAFNSEYKELIEVWRGLETKAQGNIAVAGIFIAGSLAYIQKLDPNLLRHEKVFLGIAIGCLIASVLFAIATLTTQTVESPPLGLFVDHYSNDLLKIDSKTDLASHLNTFFSEHATLWRKVLAEIQTLNESKANHLWHAQIFLIVAMLSVASLSVSKLL